MSWDRVLPKPPALYYDPIGRDFPTRTSTPVDHQIMIDKFSKIADEESCHQSVGLESRALGASLLRATIPSPETSVLAEVPPLISPIARKRPCSLITSEAARQERSASSSSSKSTSSKESSSLQFCLCQPDPKIPRPRNAFILFRQHFQASVVAQNPGLANPDISKIIGEKWRTLPVESKQDWKNLAEEEKARHQQQYPDYRYQPRRYGRNGSNNAGNSSGISNNPTGASVCNRCGGRVMNPPSTPNTPFTSSGPSPVSSTSSSSQPIQSAQRNFQERRSRDDIGLPSPIQVTRSMDRRVAVRSQLREELIPLSPDFKRRRFNGNGIYVPVVRDMSPEYPYSPRRTSLPRPDSLYPRAPYSSGVTPPGRPYRHGSTQQPPLDHSLTLPPLQTMSLSQQNQTNVEAKVMNISYLSKIKVLARISPPVRSCVSKGSSIRRGALVAVEGQAQESVQQMIQHLETTLLKDGKNVARIFKGPEATTQQFNSDKSGDSRDPTVQYLETISAWHTISKEIVSFINGTPESSSMPTGLDEPASGISPQSIVPKTAQLRIGSPDGFSPPSAPTPAPTPTSVSVPATAMPAESESPFHIALVPGYQLTTADLHACSTPINDFYTPTDHWQWMASLWRGCAGPDVTVLIRDCDKEELDKIGSNSVENFEEARTLVVRRLANSAQGVEGRVLREVGFEVEKFLRK
ncbi:HMG box transcriptional regulator [Blastomyces dermatitidis ER-3]|uniref:HMG box transcriptional regulator n=1 Tax=Ajellomyces dermatitidis (strain ER-3 / ATCC MYA-2586) TaxID=559297 RepID=A0ABP2ENC8_AJEDR|nr:HMG box transcriptional regulator [Blastomyces dermatitidis ER-3]EEQ84927.1 HMG box transcriptional regulator [Blastomyces dermatitidis ER-3]